MSRGSLKGRWVREVRRTKAVNVTVKLTLTVLADDMREDGQVSTPRRVLAQRLGKAERLVSRDLKAAVDARLLDRVARGHEGQTAVYKALLLDPPEAQRVSKTDTLWGVTPVVPLSDTNPQDEGDPCGPAKVPRSFSDEVPASSEAVVPATPGLTAVSRETDDLSGSFKLTVAAATPPKAEHHTRTASRVHTQTASRPADGHGSPEKHAMTGELRSGRRPYAEWQRAFDAGEVDEEAVLDMIGTAVGGLDSYDENAATNMLREGRHVKAIVNKINKGVIA